MSLSNRLVKVKNNCNKIPRNDGNNNSTNVLNYQKYIPVKVEKKVEIPIVDIKKIIPYSKIGKKLGRSVKEIKSRNVKLPFITSQSYEISDYNFKNPYKIIKDLANNESYVEEKFQLKKNLLENYLKTESLPTIETYETIVKEKMKSLHRL